MGWRSQLGEVWLVGLCSHRNWGWRRAYLVCTVRAKYVDFVTWVPTLIVKFGGLAHNLRIAEDECRFKLPSYAGVLSAVTPVPVLVVARNNGAWCSNTTGRRMVQQELLFSNTVAGAPDPLLDSNGTADGSGPDGDKPQDEAAEGGSDENAAVAKSWRQEYTLNDVCFKTLKKPTRQWRRNT